MQKQIETLQKQRKIKISSTLIDLFSQSINYLNNGSDGAVDGEITFDELEEFASYINDNSVSLNEFILNSNSNDLSDLDKQHIHLCKNCENRTSFSRVKIPYSAKLLFQELISMNVAPRIITEQN